MQLTILGWVFIPLGFFLLFQKTEYIFHAFIFFIPFVASSLVNVKSISFGLQLPYYLGILWMLKIIFVRLSSKKISFDPTKLDMLISLFIFWAICLISLCMPFFLEDRVAVHYPEDPFVFSNLRFKRIHITQFLYLTFGVLVTVFVADYVNTRERLYNVLRVLLSSAVFVSLWGLFQFVSFYLGISYPYWLFNNSLSFTQEFAQTLSGVKRICSVLPEPSKLASYLLWIFPLFLIFCAFRVWFIYRRRLFLYLGNILIVIALLLSTSTTAYIGILFDLGLIMVYPLGKGILRSKLSKDVLFAGIVLVIGGVILGSTIVSSIRFIGGNDIAPFSRALRSALINKVKTRSWDERKTGMLKSLKIFRSSPLLGVGFGSNRSFDLNATLLSNTGILGFLFFWGFIFNLLRRLFKLSKAPYLSLQDRVLNLAFFFSIISGMFSHVLSNPDVVNLIIWLMFGLAIANVGLMKKEICFGRNCN